jgi:hypothetical protein
VIARLLVANALELCIGLGVVCALRVPLGTAYLVGLVVVGIVSAHLALVHVAVGWTLLAIMAAASLAVGYRFAPRPLPRPGRVTLWSSAGVALLAALLVHAWPTFAAKPLDNYDGWAMWGMKAKALFLLGGADAGLFASRGAQQLHLDYPLLVPSLDAVASRAMGGFDPRLVHLQFLLDGVAAFAALAALLGRRAPGWLAWPFLLALAAAPAVTGQLVTGYADIPLAFLVAAGLLAAAGWLEDGSGRMLALATLFFAGAVLTKNEGVVFVAAAYVGLLLATRRWRPLLISAAGVELALAPWQLWLHLHHVHSDTLLGLQLFEIHHPGIGPLAFRALLHQAFRLDAWPLLLPLFLASVAAAAGTRLALFASAWALVSTVGLAWIYLVSRVEWSNYFSFSGDRVIDSVVVGATALTPLLAAQAVKRVGRARAPRAPALAGDDDVAAATLAGDTSAA